MLKTYQFKTHCKGDRNRLPLVYIRQAALLTSADMFSYIALTG